MKLLAGATLAERLERHGRLPLEEVAVITRQVGSGLAAAHAAGVLHRDIKAANILLSGAGAGINACITDFGLARTIVQESTALTVQGVP
jgi:serine/threonine-protein kinase